MNESFERCSSCGELYENTINGLNDHYYGDNPFARYHQEILSNRVEAMGGFSGSWFERLFNCFRKPKITHSALDELLDYKSKLNAKLLSSSIEQVCKTI